MVIVVPFMSKTLKCCVTSDSAGRYEQQPLRDWAMATEPEEFGFADHVEQLN